MEYEDFILQIRPRNDDRFTVNVVASPAGEAEATLALPCSIAELAGRFAALPVTPRPLESSPLATVQREIDETLPDRTAGLEGDSKELGIVLFHALFSGHIGSLFDHSLGRVAARGHGLRVKLKLNPRQAELAAIHTLPWELLYRPEADEALSLRRATPIVRYLDAPRPANATSPDRLRILVMVSSPRTYPALDLAREWRHLEAALADTPSLELDTLPQASLEALRQALLSKTYHVLHFMGHGGLDAHGTSTLILEDEGGQSRPVEGPALITELTDVGELRLVVLNACDTARTGPSEGSRLLAGVATNLVLGGIPAVVAMQRPISDRAAITFSQTFYRRLAAMDPVDAAVTEGRRAIHRQDPASTEWATPVLFLRSPDGKLFEPRSRLAGRRRLAALSLALILLLVVVLGRSWTARTPTIQLALLGPRVATTHPGEAPAQLAGRLRGPLLQKLSAAGGEPEVRILCVECAPVEGDLRQRLRLDYTVRCELRPENEGWVLSGRLFDAGLGFEPPEVIARVPDRAEPASDLRLLDIFAEALLERLGVQLDAESQATLANVPTASGEAYRRNERGLDLLARGFHDQARAAFRAALGLDPAYAASHTNLAFLAMREGDYEAAVDGFRSAAELMPRDATSRYNLGSIHAHLGHHEEAVAELRQAVSLDPAYARARNQLANVYLEFGRSREARRELEAGLGFDPSFAPLHKNLGRALLALDRPQSALEHLEIARELTSSDDRLAASEVTYWLAEAHLQAGDPEHACDAWRRYRDLDPEAIGPFASRVEEQAGQHDCPLEP